MLLLTSEVLVFMGLEGLVREGDVRVFSTLFSKRNVSSRQKKA